MRISSGRECGGGRRCLRGRAFAEHLLDGVSGDEVDEKEDEGDDKPDDWDGVGEAG